MSTAWSLVMDAAYRRYRVGKRKIQTRSTKCQKRPECATGLENATGFALWSFGRGAQKPSEPRVLDPVGEQHWIRLVELCAGAPEIGIHHHPAEHVEHVQAGQG